MSGLLEKGAAALAVTAVGIIGAFTIFNATKVDAMGDTLGEVNTSLAGVSGRLDTIGTRLDGIDGRVQELSAQIAAVGTDTADTRRMLTAGQIDIKGLLRRSGLNVSEGVEILAVENGFVLFPTTSVAQTALQASGIGEQQITPALTGYPLDAVTVDAVNSAIESMEGATATGVPSTPMDPSPNTGGNSVPSWNPLQR